MGTVEKISSEGSIEQPNVSPTEPTLLVDFTELLFQFGS